MRSSIAHTKCLTSFPAKQARNFLAVVTVAVLLSMSLSSPMQASQGDLVPEAAGDLDPGFGVGGKVTTDFFGNLDVADAMAIQADGKIVAAGVAVTSSDSSTADFALARYNQDGTLDASFGSAGKVTTQFPGSIAQAFSVAIQTDGKIVAAGSALSGTSETTSDFALARYNTNGSLDASFGSAGQVTTDFFGDHDTAVSVAIQSDGRVVAGGSARGSATGFGLTRYNADGSLDASFGFGGKVTTNVSTNSIALQADGRIVSAGGLGDFELARYDPNGSLDTSFGSGGKVTTVFFGAPPDQANAIVIQSDGKLVAAGLVRTPFENFGLARYNADGSLDAAFGVGGKVNTDIFFPENGASSIAIQGDGRIVAVGTALVFPGGFVLARFNTDGSLDAGFGSAPGGGDARAVAIQADGKIVVAGLAGSPFGPADFELARYIAGAAAQPDFALRCDPAIANAQLGTKVRVTVNIERTGGFRGDVTVTPPEPSMGIKPKSGDPFTTSDDSAVFKLKIKGGATLGEHELTFTANDNSGRIRVATIKVVVQ